MNHVNAVKFADATSDNTEPMAKVGRAPFDNVTPIPNYQTQQFVSAPVVEFTHSCFTSIKSSRVAAEFCLV